MKDVLVGSNHRISIPKVMVLAIKLRLRNEKKRLKLLIMGWTSLKEEAQG